MTCLSILLLLLGEGWLLVCGNGLASAQDGLTYTIPAQEALAGPKVADPNYLFDPAPAGGELREASITVDAGKVRAHINPLVFGACFEDLNHEIYGESFEEGPEKALPPGWRLHADWLKSVTWVGEEEDTSSGRIRSYDLGISGFAVI